MRKWLVHNFILEAWVNLFGKHVKFLRASRVLFPLVGIIGIIITTDPNYPALQWWDILMLIMLFIMLDFGFNFFPFSYFKKHPAKVEELTDEQRFSHYQARQSGQLTGDPAKHKLTPAEEKDYANLVVMMQEKYASNFAGFWNIAPILFIVIFVIIWFWLIFPYFNPDYIPPESVKRYF